MLAERRGLFDWQRGYLFPWAPVAYGLGIAGYFSLPREPSDIEWMALGVIFLLMVLACLTYPRLRQWPLMVGLCLVLAGCGVAGWRSAEVAAPKLTFRYYGPVEGRIVRVDRSQSDAVRLTLEQVRLARMSPARIPTRVRVSLHGEQGFFDPAPGQVVIMTAHLSPPSGPVEPGGYDFRRHAWFEGIGAVGYTRTPALLAAEATRDSLGLWIEGVRHAMSTRVQEALPGRIGGFATAITTGDRSAMDRATLEDLRATNLAHLLAISGLHMGLLTGVVFAALRYGFAAVPGLVLHYPVKKWAALGAVLAGAIYLALSGGNVATERAFIMVSVMFGAVLADRRAVTLRAVAVAALIVLTLRPEALYGPGFQMSFAATTALVAVFGAFRGRRYGPKWVRWIVGVAASSLVAGLATAPIGAAHFNQVPHFGLIANVLSVPVMGVLIMPAAVLAACLAPFGLEAWGLALMAPGIRWILLVAGEVATWPGAVSHVKAPGPLVLPVLAAGALWLVLWQGWARWGGAAVMAAGLVIWSGAERPGLLIAESGRLLGVMTDGGRALSKPKGDGFAARVWLENDGDPGDQPLAAERWTGPVRLAGGDVLHVTGRDAARRAADACGDHDLTVVSVVMEEVPEACTVLDAKALRRTGAVAVWSEDGALRLETVADRSGQRPWSE